MSIEPVTDCICTEPGQCQRRPNYHPNKRELLWCQNTPAWFEMADLQYGVGEGQASRAQRLLSAREVARRNAIANPASVLTPDNVPCEHFTGRVIGRRDCGGCASKRGKKSDVYECTHPDVDGTTIVPKVAHVHACSVCPHVDVWEKLEQQWTDEEQ